MLSLVWRMSPSHEWKVTSWTVGVICILLVAVDWSASSVLVQAIFTAENFNKPVFLTWLGNSLFAVLIPIKLLLDAARRRIGTRYCAGRSESDDPSVATMHAACESHGERPYEPPRTIAAWYFSAPVQRAARAGAMIAPIWFAANCTYNISMSLTSITSSTAISSSSSAFTLLLSVRWLGEAPTPLKLVGVGLCWLGNGLTALKDSDFEGGGGGGGGGSVGVGGGGGDGGGDGGSGESDKDGPSHSFIGDAVCLLGAVLYAVYTVLHLRARAARADGP